ncbi:hypothetical protein VNO78_18811 [Psophocarpus tetragonolobus]|uniref:Uncharacterized protein n=1 Tax=Psophocarpus tetragonolobus TaxID=3891 RepID=A0AAN9XFZ4_PSOTE
MKGDTHYPQPWGRLARVRHEKANSKYLICPSSMVDLVSSRAEEVTSATEPIVGVLLPLADGSSKAESEDEKDDGGAFEMAQRVVVKPTRGTTKGVGSPEVKKRKGRKEKHVFKFVLE